MISKTDLYNTNVQKNDLHSKLRSQYYLIKSQLLSLRIDWKWSLLVVLISPLSLMFLLYIFSNNDREHLIYTVTGNMVMSLVTGTMLTLGQEFGVLKQLHGFDYYAVLPIRKINLVVAYTTRSTLLTIPSMGIILLLGVIFFKIKLEINPSIIIVILLAGYSMSSIGACIGIYSKDAEQASMITQVVQPIIVFLSPVFVPANKMPGILYYISFIMPTRYVASALRSSCMGLFDIPSILILLGFCIVSLFLIEKRMDWRT